MALLVLLLLLPRRLRVATMRPTRFVFVIIMPVFIRRVAFLLLISARGDAAVLLLDARVPAKVIPTIRRGLLLLLTPPFLFRWLLLVVLHPHRSG
jgi:hypothetical protein